MNTFEAWFIRAMRMPDHRQHVREMREFELTLDDAETRAPAREKQSLRKAPETLRCPRS